MYEKFGFKYATNVLGSLTVHGPTGPLEELTTRTETAFRESQKSVA